MVSSWNIKASIIRLTCRGHICVSAAAGPQQMSSSIAEELNSNDDLHFWCKDVEEKPATFLKRRQQMNLKLNSSLKEKAACNTTDR